MQDQYRRGVALGLTMAEVMLLLIFGLLLLLAFLEFNQQSQQADDEPNQRMLNELLVLREQYKDLSEDWDVLIRKHNKEKQRAERLEMQVKTLKEGIEDTKKELDKSNKELRKEQEENEKLTRLIKELLEKLNEEESDGNTGRLSGFDHQPCWPRAGEEGLPYYYSFDATLTVYGYEVKSRPVPDEHRNEEVIKLHKRVADDTSTLSPQDFKKVTKGLHDWSRAQNPECRFIVQVKDNTGQNKDIYKERLELLESRFYKHLDK